ncbi:MAG: NUDIX domain-containing protein [Anaerolineales bacterium]|nr:NUDIX domain-containing protein [Anaerolineales bacterium]
MRSRAAAILIENERIALIERHKAGRHYFTIPGGGVEAGETPEEAALRKMAEETGLRAAIRRLAADVSFKGNQQLYSLVERVGGEFGSGQGEEMLMPQPLNPFSGTYCPVWMAVEEIPGYPLLPAEIAKLIVRAHHPGWPDGVLFVDESEVL